MGSVAHASSVMPVSSGFGSGLLTERTGTGGARPPHRRTARALPSARAPVHPPQLRCGPGLTAEAACPAGRQHSGAVWLPEPSARAGASFRRDRVMSPAPPRECRRAARPRRHRARLRNQPSASAASITALCCMRSRSASPTIAANAGTIAASACHSSSFVTATLSHAPRRRSGRRHAARSDRTRCRRLRAAPSVASPATARPSSTAGLDHREIDARNRATAVRRCQSVAATTTNASISPHIGSSHANPRAAAHPDGGSVPANPA